MYERAHEEIQSFLFHCLQSNELGQTASTFIERRSGVRSPKAINITLEAVMAAINPVIRPLSQLKLAELILLVKNNE